MDLVWKLIATAALVALNAYFVAAEFAAVGARQSRLELAAGTSFLSRLGLEIKKRLDLYLSTCQLGITIASLGLGAITEPLVSRMVDPILIPLGLSQPGANHHGLSFFIAMVISTSLHVIVGEQAPKNWAIQYADRMLPALAPVLIFFTYLFYPMIWVLNWASNWLLRISGVKLQSGAHGGLPHTEAELRALVTQAVSEGTIAKGNAQLLTSAFEFQELKVRQIMTPRTKVDFLLVDQPLGQMLKTVQKSAYSRLPLCDGDLDHVVGMVHMKDLFTLLKLTPGRLRFSDAKTPDGEAIAIADGLPGSQVHVIGSGDLNLRKIKREVLFIPELTPVPKVLRQMQSARVHMAIIVDEYGSTQGIVTLEDVLEEIVGDIEDEFDVGQNVDFVKDGENFRVSGLMAVHELKERLPTLADVDMGDVDTLGGYVVKELGRFPSNGDAVDLGAYQVRVLSVQGTQVERVLIMPATQNAMREDGPGEA